jgi:prophage antirepressor-like protein
MSAPLTFNFVMHSVRVIMIGDAPWFVAADVCDALEIGNTSLAVNGRADREKDGLDDDEKGVATVNTPSGDQQMLVINESGLYSLIFKSRKPEAKRFKKWVTSEVLPAIRKTGRYEAPAPAPVRKPIRSRDDLSFTARDDQGRFQNWAVPHEHGGDWHRGIEVGKACFAEVLELAQYNRKEAANALRFALVEGAAPNFWRGGWGIEYGFAEAIAAALFPPTNALTGTK